MIIGRTMLYLPVNDEFFAIEDLLTDWTQPSSCLFHHRVPGHGIETLGVYALRRSTWRRNPHIAQLRDLLSTDQRSEDGHDILDISMTSSGALPQCHHLAVPIVALGKMSATLP